MGPAAGLRKRRPRLSNDDPILTEPDITPAKIRQPLDEILDSLNAVWNLDLPRVHGRDTETESTPALAKQCSVRLRYLFYREVDLQQLLRDFDQRASIVYSNWSFKPHAEKNVIATRDATDSDLHRRVIRETPPLTLTQKQHLLVCLNAVLEGPWLECRQSDSLRTAQSSPIPHSRLTETSPIRLTPSMRDHTKVTKPAAPVIAPNKKPIAGSRSSIKREGDAGGYADNQLKKTKTADAGLLKFFERHSPVTVQQNRHKGKASFESDQDAMTEGGCSLLGSNETIAISDATQSLFPPTQEDDDPFEDPFIKRSLDIIDSGYHSGNQSGNQSVNRSANHSANHSDSSSTLQSRLSRTFDTSDLPPQSLGYEFVYELQSLASSWSLKANDVWRLVWKKCSPNMPTREQRLATYKDIAEGRSQESFTVSSWEPSAGLPPEKQSHLSTYQEATLLWSRTRRPDLSPFRTRLHAPRSQQSCRFHRIFGGHRFLTLNIPEWKDGKIPGISGSDFWQAISEWLCDGIQIGHRVWEPFWVEDKPKKDTKTGDRFNQVHLFATAGLGLERDQVSLDKFLDLHAPFQANKHSTNHKLFARGKLGLSKTTPTVVLRQDQFRHENDIESGTGTVMTDGCALMSADLGVAIARCLNLDQVPSAFQGRIGGAKGMWLVDKPSSFNHTVNDPEIWIEIRPSQLKILPHPAERECRDEIRTFEVCDWSRSLQPSSLNRQLLTVLYSRGVERDILATRLKTLTDDYYNELCASFERGDPLLTRAWLQKYHSGKAQRDDFKVVGGRPLARVDQIKTYLDAGFSPREREPLRDLVAEVMKNYLNGFVENLHIELACSTVAFMLPDVWGILQEGEVQLCFGEAWTDLETGMSSTFIAGIDCLVARNPANDPSDVQRVKMVHYAELAGYANIIFFSTKGHRPLADYLSGGDYDGDMAFVCWDREIVAKYRNFVHPSTHCIKPEEVGLVERSTKLSDIITREVTEGSVRIYMKTCLEFSLRQGFVGIVTNTHVEHVYYLSLNKGAIKLAALAAFLVDALKQGYELPPDSWQAVKKSICGHQLKKPAYLEPEDSVGATFRGVNILDYLRFNVARTQKNYLIDRWWEQVRKWPSRTDEHLLRPFRVLDHCADKERKENNDRVGRQVLDRLKSDLDAVSELWKLNFAVKSGKDLDASFEAIPEIYHSYKKIEPLQPEGQEDHWFCRMHAIDKRMGTNMWQSLRASCLYKNFKNPRFVWSMAGLELCEIKSRAMGLTIPVQVRTYGTMKLNLKAVKAVSEMPVVDQDLGAELIDDDDDDTQYYDALTSITSTTPSMTIRNYF